MKHIAIFASGTGSNARKIIEHFKGHSSIKIHLVVSNKPKAPVLEMAASHGISTLVIERTTFYKTKNILHELSLFQIDFIVLAGFLWLVPTYLVAAFPKKIVNIHPALLPKYGGKGMYGMHVHRAVWAAKEPTSGITIHYVNEQYDEGDVIYQAECPLSGAECPESIAQRVLKLEHEHFSRTIEEILSKKE